jgi:formylmethanofuran dehydrogenase subunit B
MQDEVARWDDLAIGLRPAACRAKGRSVRRLVSVDPVRSAKASSEGWHLRLRPNSDEGELEVPLSRR